MTSLLLTKLPRLGFRPAGGLSSRLGCHVLDKRHRGASAVPWVTRQQKRFVSNVKDNDYKDDYYAILGAKPSDPPHVIDKLWADKMMATHPDHTGTKCKDKTELHRKVRDAGHHLRDQGRKAKFDVTWYEWQTAAAEQQRAADRLGAAALARQVARLREEVKLAKAVAEAAEVKKRDEERRAEAEKQKLAEAQRQRLAAEENKRRAAVEAAKAAEKKKADEEKARKVARAADLRTAAVEARTAELARQRRREARMVVLRHVPRQTRGWDVTNAIKTFRPGRILDMGVGEGTAWVEFCTAEQATACHRGVTETDQCVIRGKTIKTAAIYQGRARPPQGSEFITRGLYIVVPWTFLDGEAKAYDLVERKLSEKGFTTVPVGIEEGNALAGKWLVDYFASIAQAQSVKAILEKHYPAIEVEYLWDFCEAVHSTQQEKRSGSSEEKSTSWLNPVNVALVVFAVISVIVDINKDEKSSGKKKQ